MRVLVDTNVPMKVHTVTRILTFNVDDFIRYRNIEVGVCIRRLF